MKHNELIKFCRYYKGQKEPPFKTTDPRYTAWRIEGLWVNAAEKQADVLNTSIDEYIRRGLADFNNKDGVPISLKAFLMNRLFQYAEREDVDEFKRFYASLYK